MTKSVDLQLNFNQMSVDLLIVDVFDWLLYIRRVRSVLKFSLDFWATGVELAMSNDVASPDDLHSREGRELQKR
jgi:hypothetical protein